MSLPVPFKEFGSTNEALYQEYCFTYREAVQYLRSATGDDVNARGGGAYVARGWNGYGGHVARRGAVSGPYRGVPVKCSLPWRTPPAHGGADDSTRANASARGSASGGDGGADVGESAVGTAGGGDADRAGGVGDSEDARGVRESASVGAGVVGADLGAGGGDTEAPSGGSVGSAIKRGKNYEKNKAKRERIKALRDAGNVPGRGKSLVSVRAAHPKLDETWAERKVRENKVAIAKLDAQLEKIEKEKRDGTAEKRYQVEANLVQGQLDGAFALVPQQRVVSWAKTVTSNGSSSAGSSGKKSQASIPSVSSGLGSRSATTVSAREKQLEEENKKLRKDMVALEYSERMKRLEIGNSVERRIMHLEDEVRRRDKLVETYKGIAGIRG